MHIHVFWKKERCVCMCILVYVQICVYTCKYMHIHKDTVAYRYCKQVHTCAYNTGMYIQVHVCTNTCSNALWHYHIHCMYIPMHTHARVGRYITIQTDTDVKIQCRTYLFLVIMHICLYISLTHIHVTYTWILWSIHAHMHLQFPWCRPAMTVATPLLLPGSGKPQSGKSQLGPPP